MTEHNLPLSQAIPDEVRFAVIIQASLPDIYRCISTAEGWNEWFTSDMSMDPRPGGRIIFHWKNWGADKVSMGDHGLVQELIPESKIVYTWHPDQPDYTTRVTLSIEGQISPYIVRVSEFGFADSPEGLHAMIQSAAGWGEALTLLKVYLEHGFSQVNREG